MRKRVLVGVLCACATGQLGARESAGFVVRALSVTTVGGISSSESFKSRMTSDFVQGAAGVCPAGMSSALGFLSALGKQEVPIVLHVEKPRGSAKGVDLRWSGQADGFVVYGSGSASFSGEPSDVLTTTASCSATAPDADEESIFYFRVRPLPR